MNIALFLPSWGPTQKIRETSYKRSSFSPQNLLESVLSSNNTNQTPIPGAKKQNDINCKMSLQQNNSNQFGKGGADVAKIASDLREWYDVKSGSNTLDSSNADNYANKIGRFLGRKYP